ncbi:MAG: tetratricopeptide repeat protein [Candidatus Micrarchaeota archaeon]
MEGIDQARSLLIARKYAEAAALLDRLLQSERDDDQLWYLRGVASLKLRNYDGAMECFERALLIDGKSGYHQIKGMAHFELFEVDEALAAFKEALALDEKNPTTHFFIALCYLFLDDPRCDEHLQRALAIDAKRTKQLLLNFYTLFIKDEPRVSLAMKKSIMERIGKL